MENFKNEIVIPVYIEMRIRGSENWNDVLRKEEE